METGTKPVSQPKPWTADESGSQKEMRRTITSASLVEGDFGASLRFETDCEAADEGRERAKEMRIISIAKRICNS